MNDFPVSKNAYVAFDGLSIKEKIKERLNQTGVFTDQNFEASNLAAINDTFGMAFSLLLYQVNQTSTNGDFSLTTLYENMNRVVKFLGYNPIGHQTATVVSTMSASNLDSGIYNIPRYSTMSIAGVPYSIYEDLSFTKTVSTSPEEIFGTDSEILLYQGTFVEYPTIIPSGNANETIVLNVDDSAIVDFSTIDVYVKTNNIWEKWEKTQSLFLNDFNAKVYEIRFNENKRYEIKFGDNINGVQLTPSNEVAIYFLKSNGAGGEIGINALNNKKLAPNSSRRLSLILADVSNNTYMSAYQLNALSFNNKYPSTSYTIPEDISSIRKNAPANFRAQFSLTTENAYESFIRTNFSNIIQDVKVKNNKKYLESYMKYFYDLGLTKPQNESRALFNQINFSDSCNFNNIYVIIVPKTVEQRISYLSVAQKQLIVDSLQEEKVLTSEIVPLDPVYIAFDFCVPSLNDQDSILNTKLKVYRTPTSRRNEASIIDDVSNKISTFFSNKNNTLGQEMDMLQLTSDILAIDGVNSISTYNESTRAEVAGIHFLYWNPVYFDISKKETSSNVSLEDFQFPYLNNFNVSERIVVV